MSIDMPLLRSGDAGNLEAIWRALIGTYFRDWGVRSGGSSRRSGGFGSAGFIQRKC